MAIRMVGLVFGSCLNWCHVDVSTTVLACSEHYSAVDECIQCVVLTDTYILAWVVNCTTLTLDDVASLGELSAEDFNA